MRSSSTPCWSWEATVRQPLSRWPRPCSTTSRDTENGGFYFTSALHEQLIHRPRSLSDDALPSGAAVAARALLKLSQATPGPRYAAAAERVLRAGWEPMNQHPLSHTALCLALDEWLRPNACRLDGTC